MELFNSSLGAALVYEARAKFSVLVFIILIFFDNLLAPEDIGLSCAEG